MPIFDCTKVDDYCRETVLDVCQEEMPNQRVSLF